VTEHESWLEQVEIVARGQPVPEDPAASVQPEARPGDPVPPVVLVDQDGAPLPLSDLRGRRSR